MVQPSEADITIPRPKSPVIQDPTEIRIIDQIQVCVECKDQQSQLYCKRCDDEYCYNCFKNLHRAGNRALHKITILPTVTKDEDIDIIKNDPNLNVVDISIDKPILNTIINESNDNSKNILQTDTIKIVDSTTICSDNNSTTEDSNTTIWAQNDELEKQLFIYPNFLTQIRFIPLRLTENERVLQQVQLIALNMTEYTNRVDIQYSRKDKQTVMVEEFTNFLSSIIGITLTHDFHLGRKISQKDNYSDNSEFFQNIFEIGRRHKIRNPDKMRTTYGRLVHILMDSHDQSVQSAINFQCIIPIKTIETLCEEYGIVSKVRTMLEDPSLLTSTSQINMAAVYDLISTQLHDMSTINNSDTTTNDNNTNTFEKYVNNKVQEIIEYRQNAWKYIVQTYSMKKTHDNKDNDRYTGQTKEQIELILYSICDCVTYLSHVTTPIHIIYSQLFNYFSVVSIGRKIHMSLYPVSKSLGDLDIRTGIEGSRLTHTHEIHFRYIAQTFELWIIIIRRIFELWYYADMDMTLSTNTYRLMSTGQGLHRVQTSYNVARTMTSCLHTAQYISKWKWIGSSTIHLGDINVPNALVFIDKYCQIERILNPIVFALRKLEQQHCDSAQEFENNILQLRKQIQEQPTVYTNDILREKVNTIFLQDLTFNDWIHGYTIWKKLKNINHNQIATFIKLIKNEPIEYCEITSRSVPFSYSVCCKMMIDFFKHGFDGSGADDYFSAGSCIDGRLTSMWNWTSEIDKKYYFYAFQTTGFYGFDGSFSD